MKQKLQGLLSGIAIGAVLTGGATFAKSGSELIEAFYSDIKIFIDGTELLPKDVNGASAEPFIYNGTTYLPARAIGEAVGKQVMWDAEKKHVYLTEPEQKAEQEPLPTTTPAPTPTVPTPTPSATPKPTVTPTPTATPTQSKHKNVLTTTRILQISGYREDAIKGKVEVAWTPGQANAEFHANLRCNNGGLADYVTCKIDLTETVSVQKQEIQGYFKVQHNDTVKYDRIEGTITVNGTEIVLHTKEYDYHLVAEAEEKRYYSDWKTTTSMVMDVKNYNEEKASGMLTFDFNENKTDAKISGNIKVNGKTYTIQPEAITAVTEQELVGTFTVLCDGEAVLSNTSGKVSNLHAALGETLTFSIGDNVTLELFLVETVHNPQ